MELPVTLSPPVKAYPAYGFPLSILYARDDRFDPWLLGQFITVVGERSGYSLLKAEYDWMYTAEGVFKYHRYRLPPGICAGEGIPLDAAHRDPFPRAIYPRGLQ